LSTPGSSRRSEFRRLFLVIGCLGVGCLGGVFPWALGVWAATTSDCRTTLMVRNLAPEFTKRHLIDLLKAGCLSWRVQIGVIRVTTTADNITETDCPISQSAKNNTTSFCSSRGCNDTDAHGHPHPAKQTPPDSTTATVQAKSSPCPLSTEPETPSNSHSDASVLEDDQSTRATRRRLTPRPESTPCSSEESLYYDFRLHQIQKPLESR
jgi:hypothetical protein